MNNTDYEDKYDELFNIISGPIKIGDKEFYLKDEFEKFFVKGNKTAGIRIRKAMQMLRATSEGIRKDVQTYKSTI